MSTVIAVDIGTTSTKAVAYRIDATPSLQAGASHSVAYALDEPRPGWAEQDPDAILGAVIECVRIVASPDVVALSFSSAMHSLIGLDAHGELLTRSITWADLRAGAQAERIRASPAGPALHRRTGTPIHPMSPLVKLVWLRENEPELFARATHWVAIKDYVLLRLCGALGTDHSLASGTGLFDLHTLRWDPEALALAGIEEDQLPAPAPTTTLFANLVDPGALGVPAATAVVLGAADGPLANLGLGAVEPGVAACSIGTSGALRVMVARPALDPDGGVFCYALTPGHWTVGGAINNGGAVLRWAGAALAPDLGPDAYDELLALAAAAPPGSAGLVMLPYLLGERAPYWDSRARGAYVGLGREHGRPHLIRAALEGVCLQLALVLDSVRAAGHEITAVRATGGFARSPWWRQLLADVLDMPVQFPRGHEGSSLGAALLAMQALGLIESIDAAAELVGIEQIVHPEPEAARVYQDSRPTFAQLYGALRPTFAALEQNRRQRGADDSSQETKPV